MATQHTPGPWAIDPDDRLDMEWNNHIVVEADPNLRVCFMAHSGRGREDNSEAEANARLIAAAPELLAALAEIDRLSLVISSAVYRADASHDDAVATAIRAARAAIAKATGATV